MRENAGALNKRITIVKIGKIEDQDGYWKENPEVVHSCWAKFSRTSGTEVVRANADFGEIKARFLIRYTKKKLSRKMIVQYAGNEYEIQYINDYGDRHEYIEIWCKLMTLKGETL